MYKLDYLRTSYDCIVIKKQTSAFHGYMKATVNETENLLHLNPLHITGSTSAFKIFSIKQVENDILPLQERRYYSATALVIHTNISTAQPKSTISGYKCGF